jgi:hypothetical protein
MADKVIYNTKLRFPPNDQFIEKRRGILFRQEEHLTHHNLLTGSSGLRKVLVPLRRTCRTTVIKFESKVLLYMVVCPVLVLVQITDMEFLFDQYRRQNVM